MRTVILMILLLSSVPIYSTVSNETKAIELKGDCESPQSKSLSFPLKVYIEGNTRHVSHYDYNSSWHKSIWNILHRINKNPFLQ